MKSLSKRHSDQTWWLRPNKEATPEWRRTLEAALTKMEERHYFGAEVSLYILRKP
jgi:hypothetical protein